MRKLPGDVLSDVDLDVRPGEVVGVTGVVGAGWDELPYLLAGARRPTAGVFTVGSTSLRLDRASTRSCIAAGIALLPANRTDDGVAVGLTVTEDVTLPRVGTRGRRLWTGTGWQRSEAVAMINTLDVRPQDPDRPVGQLSGGNQQKVLLGKWLAGEPRLLVLHEPTQAVGIGAREDILQLTSPDEDTIIDAIYSGQLTLTSTEG